MIARTDSTAPPASTRREKRISLAHGGGGVLTDELVRGVVLPRVGNDVLRELLDAGVVGDVAVTIDSYVVRPLTFPGGDIGRLAVSGTVNDLAVCGADVTGIALSFILEEGLETAVVAAVAESVGATAREAGVAVVTGDTKVVGRGQADGMYVTTAGVGRIPAGRSRMRPGDARPGDIVIVSGTVGDHGMAVMLAREMPEVRSAVRSDVAPLNGMVRGLLDAVPGVVFMRDATRGGIAGVVTDLAAACGWRVSIDAEAVPVRPATLHAAEMLGVDVLDIANEGKVVVVVRAADAERAVAALRSHAYGKDACVIGRVDDVRDGSCELLTGIGGRRVLQKPYGEQLPRIC